MKIRNATLDDLDALANIEQECFSPAEACKREDFKERLKVYPNHFWLLIEDGKIISFANGFATNEKDLTDAMYENASLHDEDGDWQMIFGLNTLPEYRRKGYAGLLVEKVIETARKENRLGVVLTCKGHLTDYYSRFGFVDEGISESKHGGEVWNQMRLTIEKSNK